MFLCGTFLTPERTFYVYVLVAAVFIVLYVRPGMLIESTLGYLRMSMKLLGITGEIKAGPKSVKYFRRWLALLILYTLALAGFVAVCLDILKR